ncbi:MAG: hypothetical protein Athens101410_663 [Parcubacteria group bacterium Athens1014_10]|nr:MAG: hypothetical protein Athens101410_663 [Parcubacteria group bacterium Athens1014_10]TSD05992.1 MAG: hypothetical protein Athens071412_139 [Parcubacteria group bacterium Athens0714_12]
MKSIFSFSRKNNKLVLIIAILIIAMIIFIFSNKIYQPANAQTHATYYVDGSAINDSGTGTELNPKKYIKSGIALMSKGDTLIIKSGVYTGMQNMMCTNTGWEWNGIPNGSADAYTTIKAEHDFGVIIDGEGISPRNPVYIYNRSYIQFEGLVFRNSGGPGATNFHLYYCNHIKVLRCAAYEPMSSANPPADDVYYNFYVQRSTYCLLEDCFAWGRARYQFSLGGEWGNHSICSNNILRRCVARYDKSEEDSNEQAGCFTNYGAGPNWFQNCISIDGADPGNCGSGTMRAFYGANGSTGVVVDSSIALNNVDGRLYWESASTGTYLKNSVFYDMAQGSQWYTPPALSDIRVENCLFGDLGPGTDPYGCGLNVEDRAQFVRNNIFYKLSDIALVKSDSGVDYNCLYGNRANYSGTNAGAHDITNRNPITNGLLYLVRIEDGSYLKTGGMNEGQIGPQIIKRLGISGTLYGDAGWDTLTDDNLWPFPQEDTIRSWMRQYNLHGVSGNRGFVTDGNGLYGGPITLTSYIWEYLGNPCPSDICNYGSTPEPEPIIPPSITLTKQVDRAEASTGDTLTYTLTYQNTSAVEARNIVITDEIPEGTTYIANSATNGGTYNSGAGELTWTISSLSAGVSGQVSFQARVE